ncbi:HAD family hydrolase [Arthrobacter sp. MMS18-M83]|uniref:HAD family hydrolase n=1 Tax=Arthrobacter sp. MMS18-M83 TaxID=2996261 RepID=UPI00227B8D68|nr:HAD family hydrolase [Arthrobacter sp. MMS18-M83]WAH95235.1 HAD family hydrolase [Arthrobacter sp. MMS18-M83]
MAVFFFDGDQTLWDFQAMMRRALAATIGELSRLRPGTGGDMSVEPFVTDREAVAERLRGHVTNLEQVRFEAFRQSLARLRLGDDDLAAHLNEFYLQRRFADVMLYDDVLPVLAELRRNHHVGLLSNGNSYPKRLGLEDCFQAAVLSQDHGVEKPDRRIFDIASDLLPGEPRIMVGDSLANDVAGAQAAGWTGVWLNREGAATPKAAPDLMIRSLHELLPMAKAL